MLHNHHPKSELTPSLEKKLRTLCDLVQGFEPEQRHGDLNWNIHLKIERKWIRLSLKFYDDCWYGTVGRDQRYGDIETFSFSFKKEEERLDPPGPKVEALIPAINIALAQIYTAVKRDPIEYHADLMRSLPPTMRYGVIPSSFVRDLVPDWRAFDQELSSSEMKRMLEICERQDPGPEAMMTAARFFEYCKAAYLANPETFTRFGGQALDPALDGRELYRRYADGRDGGLKEIELGSEEAFSKWYHGDAHSGGHPWEIYRGGNSTHIDLAVLGSKFRGAEGWQVLLSAFSSTRLIECCRIALALDKHRLPFQLSDKESYSLRLRNRDLVGIVPEYASLDYGWREFPKEFKVADSVQFSMFRDERTGKQIRPWRELAAVVTWLPIPPLMIRRGLDINGEAAVSL